MAEAATKELAMVQKKKCPCAMFQTSPPFNRESKVSCSDFLKKWEELAEF